MYDFRLRFRVFGFRVSGFRVGVCLKLETRNPKLFKLQSLAKFQFEILRAFVGIEAVCGDFNEALTQV